MNSKAPSERILVVDDNESHRQLFSIALTRAGYLVDIADDGTTAWEMLQVEHYALLITDNNMPKMSGVELIEKLRTSRSKIAAILATSDLPPNTDPLQLAATLVKPFSLYELVRTAKEVLARSLPMVDPGKLKEFGRRLLTCETALGNPAGIGNHEFEKVYEKLRSPLVKLLGLDSFQSLMARALILAGEEIRWLRSLRITKTGEVEGLDGLESRLGPGAETLMDGEAALLAHFLGLLITFIGSALTLQLLHDIWPNTNDLKF